ncbi:MAG: type VI secretion system-associated protein TagO [Methylococcaceae bacterium]|nr:type VI secretion system-associated protein TagO [Methylococcaceae bacterium]
MADKKQNISSSIFLSLFLVFLAISKLAWGENQQPIKNPKKCTEIKSSLERLTCFDQYFETPIKIAKKKDRSNPIITRQLKIMQMAMRVEEGRNDGTSGLLREEIVEHESADQQRIILTTPAIGSHPPRPLLMISCINNITRLQIGLHTSISRGRVNVALGLKNRTQQTDYSWRVLGNGQIIDAGHGIPSINLLKTMIGHTRVFIHSEDMSLEGLTFDITGFTHYIKSFRIACHW